MKAHQPYGDIDPFDPIDAVDALADSLDGEDTTWYSQYAPPDVPLCDFGLGDEDEFCTRDKYGCNIEGCEHSGANR